MALSYECLRHVYNYDCAVAQVYSLNGVGETIGLPPILHKILENFAKHPSSKRATGGRPYGVVGVILSYNDNNEPCAKQSAVRHFLVVDANPTVILERSEGSKSEMRVTVLFLPA